MKKSTHTHIVKKLETLGKKCPGKKDLEKNLETARSNPHSINYK